jgi:hypothetical protein
LAEAENVTGPVPLPLAPAVMVSHEFPLAAVHVHPVGAVTLVDPVPPAAASDALADDSEYVQGAAACVTVNVCPAIVIVPWRDCVTVFCTAENVIEPLPLPLEPPVTDSHAGALLTAVHEQPASVVIAADPVPPAAATEPVNGDTV